MTNEHKIEFQIEGVGYICIPASSKNEALEKFAEMNMGELAGYCVFSDYERPSGIHIIRIDDDEYQADLHDVEAKSEEGTDDPQ